MLSSPEQFLMLAEEDWAEVFCLIRKTFHIDPSILTLAQLTAYYNRAVPEIDPVHEEMNKIVKQRYNV